MFLTFIWIQTVLADNLLSKSHTWYSNLFSIQKSFSFARAAVIRVNPKRQPSVKFVLFHSCKIRNSQFSVPAYRFPSLLFTAINHRQDGLEWPQCQLLTYHLTAAAKLQTNSENYVRMGCDETGDGQLRWRDAKIINHDRHYAIHSTVFVKQKQTIDSAEEERERERESGVR